MAPGTVAAGFRDIGDAKALSMRNVFGNPREPPGWRRSAKVQPARTPAFDRNLGGSTDHLPPDVACRIWIFRKPSESSFWLLNSAANSCRPLPESNP